MSQNDPPSPSPSPVPPEPSVRAGSRRRRRTLWVAASSTLLTLAALGIWRALSLGTEGVAAAGLILSATTLLVTVVGLYVSALFSQNPLPRPDAATVGYTLLTSFVATLTFGLIGAHWYATRPVDVTSRIAWPKDLDNPSTATATRAALAVPGSLKRLSIRVHLQDMRPSVGNCSGSTFDVQRIGDSQPTKRVLSDHTVEVRIPNGVRRLVITLTVHPDTECTMAAFIESAVFHQE